MLIILNDNNQKKQNKPISTIQMMELMENPVEEEEEEPIPDKSKKETPKQYTRPVKSDVIRTLFCW